MSKDSKEDVAKNKISNILIIMAAISLLTLLIVLAQSDKINQDHIFKTNYISDYDKGSLTNGLVINNDSFAQFQRFIINPSDSVDYTFCFRNSKNSSFPLDISLVDEEFFVLGRDYFINTSTYDCIYTNNTLSRKQYLGVVCNNCDISNYLVIQEELLGSNVKKLTGENGSLVASEGATNGYVLRQHMNGKYLLRLLSSIYNTALFLLLLGILVMVGYENFKDMLTGIEQ